MGPVLGRSRGGGRKNLVSFACNSKLVCDINYVVEDKFETMEQVSYMTHNKVLWLVTWGGKKGEWVLWCILSICCVMRCSFDPGNLKRVVFKTRNIKAGNVKILNLLKMLKLFKITTFNILVESWVYRSV